MNQKTAMKSALSGSIASLRKAMDGEEVIELDIELTYEEGNYRKTSDPVKQAELNASVKARGVQQPIIVVERELGHKVVFGNRRRRAVIANGLPTVPAIIRVMTDEEILLVRLIENIHRESVPLLEEAAGFREILDLRGDKRGERKTLAQELGISESTISERLSLLELPAPVLAAVQSGSISDATLANRVGRIYSKNQGIGDELLSKAADGSLTRDVVKVAVEQIENPEPELTEKTGNIPPKNNKKLSKESAEQERDTKTVDLFGGAGKSSPETFNDYKGLSANSQTLCQNLSLDIETKVREIFQAVGDGASAKDQLAQILNYVQVSAESCARANGLEWADIVKAISDYREKSGGESSNGR